MGASGVVNPPHQFVEHHHEVIRFHLSPLVQRAGNLIEVAADSGQLAGGAVHGDSFLRQQRRTGARSSQRTCAHERAT